MERLEGGATISGGAVQLSAGSSQYVDFNGSDIGSLSATTIEVWGTYSTSNTNVPLGDSTRIFDFASGESAELG